MGACASAPQTLQDSSDVQHSNSQQQLLPSKTLPDSGVHSVLSNLNATQPDQTHSQRHDAEKLTPVTETRIDGDSVLLSDHAVAAPPNAAPADKLMANTVMCDREVSKPSNASSSCRASTCSGSNPSLQTTQAGNKVLS